MTNKSSYPQSKVFCFVTDQWLVSCCYRNNKCDWSVTDGNGNVTPRPLIIIIARTSKVILREDENSLWIMFRIYVVHIKHKYSICQKLSLHFFSKKIGKKYLCKFNVTQGFFFSKGEYLPVVNIIIETFAY